MDLLVQQSLMSHLLYSQCPKSTLGDTHYNPDDIFGIDPGDGLTRMEFYYSIYAV